MAECSPALQGLLGAPCPSPSQLEWAVERRHFPRKEQDWVRAGARLRFIAWLQPPPRALLAWALTQGDGRPALGTAVVLAVQPCLGADAQLVLGLVADFGTHAGLGDEVQALAVTTVVTPWGGGGPTTGFLEGGSSCSPDTVAGPRCPRFPPEPGPGCRATLPPNSSLTSVGPTCHSHLDAQRASNPSV